MKKVMLSMAMVFLAVSVAAAASPLSIRVTDLEMENIKQQLQIDQNAVDNATQQIEIDLSAVEDATQQLQIDQNTMNITTLSTGGGVAIETLHVQAFVSVVAGFQNTAVAVCPVDWVLTGCGFETSIGTDIFRSRQAVGFGTPNPALVAWRQCQATAQNNTTFTGQLFGNAICMRIVTTP